jgi:hypothetical protein
MSLSEEQTKKRHFAAYFCLRYKKEKRVTLQEAYDFIEKWMRKTYGEPAFTSFNALKIFLHRHDCTRSETFGGENESNSPTMQDAVALIEGHALDGLPDSEITEATEVPVQISHSMRPKSCPVDDTKSTIDEERTAFLKRIVCQEGSCPKCGTAMTIREWLEHQVHRKLTVHEAIVEIRKRAKEMRIAFSEEVLSEN